MYISDEGDPGREALIPDARIEGIIRLMDQEIEEASLRVVHAHSDELVTVIEVLSPRICRRHVRFVPGEPALR